MIILLLRMSGGLKRPLSTRENEMSAIRLADILGFSSCETVSIRDFSSAISSESCNLWYL